MCCIQYFQCEDADSFTLDQKNDAKGYVDNMCSKDYVGIEGKLAGTTHTLYSEIDCKES